jgi:hypothetical protein
MTFSVKSRFFVTPLCVFVFNSGEEALARVLDPASVTGGEQAKEPVRHRAQPR